MAMFEDDPYGVGQPRRRRPEFGGTAPMVQTTATPRTAVPRGMVPSDDGSDPTAPTTTTAPATTPVPAPPPKPTYGLTGFDQGKLDDPAHNTFKYQFGRIARGYNPQQGIQSGMLDDLNKLGFASFYGSGQHLGYRGVTDAGRQAGMDPNDFEGDFIQSWQNGQNPNAAWQYDWFDPNASASFPSTGMAWDPANNPYEQGGITGGSMLDFLKSLNLGNQPAAPSAPPMTFTLPEQNAPASVMSPDMAPSLVSGMGSPEVSRALQVLAMRYPGVLPQAQQDPNSLIAQIMRLVGA